MSLAWIAGHRVWRLLPVWALATGLNTSFLLGVIFWRAATEVESISTLTLTLVAWVGVATYLAFTDVRTRCTHFEMSLPVASRKLWLNSLMTTVAGGLGIVALTLGVILLNTALLAGVEIASGGLLALLLCMGLLLATLLLQAPRPSLFRIPITPGQVVWTIVVLVGTPVLLGVAATTGWPGLTLLLGLVAVVAIWSYRSIPSSYSLTPFEPQTSVRAEPTALATEGRFSGLLLPLTILRSVSSGAKELLAVPFILLFGVALGGGLLAIEAASLRELRFLYLPMTTYMMFALMGPRLASLHHLDPLPLSRRAMAAALVTPYFLVLCVGYAAGSLFAGGAMSRLEYVDFEETDDGYRVTVPLRVYAVAWDGKPPPVEAPWGESHEPDSFKPFDWNRTSVYSPYSAPPGSSRRFVALQISRAAEAVYGTSITPGTIDERYLITREDGSVAPREKGLTLRTDYSDLRPAAGPMFPVLVTLTVVPWLLATALLLRAYRAPIREWVRQAIVWGSLVVLLGLVIGNTMATVFDVVRPWTLRALVEIPVMQLGRTPAGTFVVWLTGFLLIVGSYRLVSSQFRRMEIPTEPSQYTLIRSRQD